MLRSVSRIVGGIGSRITNSTAVWSQMPCGAVQNVVAVNSAKSLFAQPSRSLALYRGVWKTGSHYDNDSMVNAKNPDLPKDPVLAEAACKIFGTAPTSNPHARSVRKLLMKPAIGSLVTQYYPEYLRHNQHGYQDPFRVRAEEKLQRLKRRGKGPPKKGQGKRAAKRK